MMEKLVHLLTLPLFAASLVLIIASTAGAQPPPGDFAGSESCQDCHDARTEDFMKSVHGNKLDRRTPASANGCESCHGPRGEHVREMEAKKRIPEDDAHYDTTVNPSVCLDCHNKGKLVMWEGGEHARRDLTCSDCHSVHGTNKSLLAAKSETNVCSTCHKDIRAQLLKSSHHPIREGKMTCSDCHNPHGTVAENLISANTVNEKCWECHADLRGPFLWEHAPVVEDCTNCHTAHGSMHTPLLVARTPFLCQQCHSNSRHPGTLYAQPAGTTASVYSTLNNRAYYRNCLNCHSQVHGSNHPSGKPLAR